MRSTSLLVAILLSLFAGLAASAQDDPPQPVPEEVQHGTIEVYVLDEEDEPIFKATAYLVLTEAERQRKQEESTTGAYRIDSVSTDPDGFVEFEVPAGEKRELKVYASGVDAKQTIVEIDPMKPGESREITVHLKTKPDVDAVLRVIDPEGKPLEGVEVFSVDRMWGGTSQRFPFTGKPAGVTDADGLFSMRVRSWSSTTVAIQGVGLSPALVDVSGRDAKARGANEPVTMKPAAVFRGILRSDDGPLDKGVEAHLEGRSYSMTAKSGSGSFSSGDVQFVAKVGMDGRFLFDELPADVPLLLKIVRGRKVLLRETTPRTFAANENIEVALTMGLGLSVSGRVLEADGTPAAGVPIWLATKEGTFGKVFQSYKKPARISATDEEGRFTFEKVDPGKWCVGLAPLDRRSKLDDSRKYPALFEVIDVGSREESASEKAEELAPVEFTVYRGLFLTGTALTPDGEKAPRPTSVFASGQGFNNTNVDRDGAFRLGPLAPGDYTVEARLLSFGAESGPSMAPSEPIKCTVASGKVADALELRLRPGASIKVWGAVATTGERVPTSYAYSVGNGGSTMSHGFEPHHNLSNLAPATYSIVVKAEDGRIGLGSFELEAGDQLEEELALEPGGSVEVRYVGAVEYGQIQLIQRGQVMALSSVRTGTSDTLSAMTGAATIRVYSAKSVPEGEAFEIEREVEVKAGETIRVEIKAP